MNMHIFEPIIEGLFAIIVTLICILGITFCAGLLLVVVILGIRCIANLIKGEKDTKDTEN